MSRFHGSAFEAAAADARGFTLLEVVVVCAILGVLTLLALPQMTRFVEREQTKSSATRVAGVLEEARSHAVSEATPHLVYINPPTVGSDGSCGAFAVLVRDADRSYSITEGDNLREIELDQDACGKVKAFGESGSTSDAALPLPEEDLAVRGLELGGTTGELVAGVEEVVVDLLDPNGSSSGEGSTTDTGTRTELVADAVVYGATFPIDAESGRPVIAFSERGIPVDPESPATWGSGAGGVYLTDGHSSVYAALVQPMGGVKLRVFDRSAGDWR